MSNHAGRRILIVEDDHESRLVLSRVLAEAGFQVNAVADGTMALAMLRSSAIDVVVLDALLPKQDGFSICRAIKREERIRRVPVLMLTALSAAEARERSLDAGADEFIEKPYRIEALVEIIEQLIAIHDSAKHLDQNPEAVVDAFAKTRG